MDGIHIHTLGGLRVEVDGAALDALPSQPVRCALLVYLAVQQRATRDELTALLWPERPAERARHALSQNLYELRRQLGTEWVQAAGDQLATAGVDVDAARFGRLLQEGRLEEAIAAWRGEFLAGVHLAASEPFESWLTQRRAQLLREFRGACRALCDRYAAAGSTADALRIAQTWTDADPLDDEAHHRLIELLADAGQRAAALRCYDDYRARLAAELELEPLDGTKALVARLRAAEPSPADVTPVLPVPAAGAGAPVTPVPPTGADAPVTPRARRMLAAAVVLVAVVTAAAVLVASRGARTADAADSDTASLAVLPFTELDGAADGSWFGDGLAEDLLSRLSAVDGLRVISRTSSWRYRGSTAGAPGIARELGVAHILTGTVRHDGDRVRIAVQLVDARRDTQLWAETFDGERAAIFELQDDIAARIAAALARRIGQTGRTPVVARGTSSVVAYDLLLRGREYLNRPGEADARKFGPAVALFHQALLEDPSYSRVHAALSEAYRTNASLPMVVRRDSALHYAQLAVRTTAAPAEAYAALGWARLIARQWDAAADALADALGADPNHVDALTGLARLAWAEGRYADAVRWQRTAARLDPASPQRLGTLGSFLLDLGDLAGGEAAFRRAVQLAPDAPAPAYALAQLYLIREDDDAADAVMRDLMTAAAGHPGAEFLYARYQAQRGRHELASALLARTASVLHGAAATVALQQAFVAQRLGQDARAAELLAAAEADIDAREGEGFTSPRLRLQLAALRGDADAAMAALRRRWQDETGGDLLAGPQLGLYWLDRDPLLASLLHQPPFQETLRAIRRELDGVRGSLALD